MARSRSTDSRATPADAWVQAVASGVIVDLGLAPARQRVDLGLHAIDLEDGVRDVSRPGSACAR